MLYNKSVPNVIIQMINQSYKFGMLNKFSLFEIYLPTYYLTHLKGHFTSQLFLDYKEKLNIFTLTADLFDILDPAQHLPQGSLICAFINNHLLVPYSDLQNGCTAIHPNDSLIIQTFKQTISIHHNLMLQFFIRMALIYTQTLHSKYDHQIMNLLIQETILIYSMAKTELTFVPEICFSRFLDFSLNYFANKHITHHFLNCLDHFKNKSEMSGMTEKVFQAFIDKNREIIAQNVKRQHEKHEKQHLKQTIKESFNSQKSLPLEFDEKLLFRSGSKRIIQKSYENNPEREEEQLQKVQLKDSQRLESELAIKRVIDMTKQHKKIKKQLKQTRTIYHKEKNVHKSKRLPFSQSHYSFENFNTASSTYSQPFFDSTRKTEKKLAKNVYLDEDEDAQNIFGKDFNVLVEATPKPIMKKLRNEPRSVTFDSKMMTHAK